MHMHTHAIVCGVCLSTTMWYNPQRSLTVLFRHNFFFIIALVFSHVHTWFARHPSRCIGRLIDARACVRVLSLPVDYKYGCRLADGVPLPLHSNVCCFCTDGWLNDEMFTICTSVWFVVHDTKELSLKLDVIYTRMHPVSEVTSANSARSPTV